MKPIEHTNTAVSPMPTVRTRRAFICSLVRRGLIFISSQTLRVVEVWWLWLGNRAPLALCFLCVVCFRSCILCCWLLRGLGMGSGIDRHMRPLVRYSPAVAGSIGASALTSSSVKSRSYSSPVRALRTCTLLMLCVLP